MNRQVNGSAMLPVLRTSDPLLRSFRRRVENVVFCAVHSDSRVYSHLALINNCHILAGMTSGDLEVHTLQTENRGPPSNRARLQSRLLSAHNDTTVGGRKHKLRPIQSSRIKLSASYFESPCHPESTCGMSCPQRMCRHARVARRSARLPAEGRHKVKIQGARARGRGSTTRVTPDGFITCLTGTRQRTTARTVAPETSRKLDTRMGKAQIGKDPSGPSQTSKSDDGVSVIIYILQPRRLPNTHAAVLPPRLDPTGREGRVPTRRPGTIPCLYSADW